MNSSLIGRCSPSSTRTITPFHSNEKDLPGQSWNARWKLLSHLYGDETPHRYQTPSSSCKSDTLPMFGPTSFEYSPFRHCAQCLPKDTLVTCFSHRYLNLALTSILTFTNYLLSRINYISNYNIFPV